MKDLINRAYRYGEDHVATVALVSLGLGVVLAVLVAVGILKTWEVERRITHIEPRVTKIEQTPCAKQPSGRACQRLTAEIERKANTQVNCIPFLRAGYVCPKPGSPLAERIASAANQSGGTTAPAGNPSEDGSDSSPPTEVASGGPGHNSSPEKLPHHASGGTPGAHQHHPATNGNEGGEQGGDEQAPASSPPSSGGDGGSASATVTVESPGSSEEGHEAAGGDPVGEGVGHVVEQVGETVHGLGEAASGVVEETGHGVTCVLSPDC